MLWPYSPYPLIALSKRGYTSYSSTLTEPHAAVKKRPKGCCAIGNGRLRNPHVDENVPGRNAVSGLELE